MRFLLRVILAAVIGSALGLLVRKYFRPAPVSPPAVEQPAEPSGSVPRGDAPPEPQVADVAAPVEKTPPYPVGWVMGRGRIVVQLSDGTTRIRDRRWTGDRVDLSDPVEQATSSHVVIDGKRLYINSRFWGGGAGSQVDSAMPDGAQGSPVVSVAVNDAGIRTDPSGWTVGADGVHRPARPSFGPAR